jgi:transcriptional regulator with XRE-family HTH domain
MAIKTPEIRIVLSKNLKAQRNKIGISQEKFAEISGLSVQTINDIEGGRRWVSDKTITKISSALHIECYQLLIPEFNEQNKKGATSTQHMLRIKKNMLKGINSQIETNFTDLLKSGILK